MMKSSKFISMPKRTVRLCLVGHSTFADVADSIFSPLDSVDIAFFFYSETVVSLSLSAGLFCTAVILQYKDSWSQSLCKPFKFPFSRHYFINHVKITQQYLLSVTVIYFIKPYSTLLHARFALAQHRTTRQHRTQAQHSTQFPKYFSFVHETVHHDHIQ